MQRYKGEKQWGRSTLCGKAGPIWKAWDCVWGVWSLSYRRRWGARKATWKSVF